MKGERVEDINGHLFEGITVVELGHVIAAPFVASLLSDFGANVIKVEDPETGDMMRSTGPARDGVHLWWKVAGRNKTSVTIDMRQSAGQELVRELAERADVVVENFRPGTLERWNIGWSELHARNPQLVMLRISGYGQVGPERVKPGYGRVGEAMSGAVHISGWPDKPPTHFGFSLGDLSTGLMGAFAVAGSLYKREHLGEDFPGECIDLALYETLFRAIDWQIILYDQLGFIPQRNGNTYPVGPSPVSNTYLTQDGVWLTVASGTLRSVFNLIELVGGPEARSDPRFSTHELQMEHKDELDELVREWIASKQAKEVFEACAEAGVVAAPILTPADMMEHPTFEVRGNIVTVSDPDLGQVRMTGVVPRLMNFPGSVRTSGPGLGAGNRKVLIEGLGLSEAEYGELVRAGVVTEPESSERGTHVVPEEAS